MMFKYQKKPIVIEAFQLIEFCYKKLADQLPKYNQGLISINTLIFYVQSETRILYPKEKLEFPEWFEKAIIDRIVIAPGSKKILIKTLEGRHEVSPLDWIIKGVEGELYPCKPEIFQKTYTKVNSV